MRALVLGAGLQGSAAAYDLARSEGVTGVLLADREQAALDVTLTLPGLVVETRVGDLSAPAVVDELLAETDLCFSALPYFMNLPVAEACARRGVHYVDLGGNTDIVLETLKLDPLARASGASLVPDCGLAPGLSATVSMAAIDGLDQVDELRIRVGGLPQNPTGPLGYSLFFSIHGLLNEYMGEAVILRDGEVATLPTLEDVERIDFPAPIGRCEAFPTLGGTSTLPWTLAGKVTSLNYKTVRYPGHVEKIRLFKDLGFFSEDAIEIDGVSVAPRALSGRLLERALREEGVRDVVVFRVEAEGRIGGRRLRRRFQLIDRFDEATGLSAMRRTTSFPASVVLQLLGRGESAGPGAHKLELAVDAERVIAELAKRGLVIERSEESL